ncbi:hypothetical protein KDRO_C02750 [Kluyveromyces lactis]|uniref:KLLA0C16555p n=1 Tax=Kluyveromyces lactis (strain ATCC 8585 / CBS 2359 / DSM 70799 / NBRC 1267 / NRRL Y-1140 / WM37) TaxID=284590 RepID=Q6CSZ9_KLULA|nr:uncharacterized protein KLLA0_C16555g [Kluyveromyces lactis]QEU59754.1 hypothetical protein KDRO_C02750 [Kluyveromyces lactis]CAH01791.1 KLLA0C16555p [Kluyveromyces lactis]|eukprot:XP_452940.1 uncharacterized protein KLLA0_C16555g [Kluyveromyces lactis]
MSSNITSLFNPPAQRDLTDEETRDCIPCQIMATAFSLGFGGYLASGKPFQYGEAEKKKGVTVEQFAKLNPKWWVSSARLFGGALIAFGIYRGTEGWLWNKEKKYKVW